MKRVAVFKISDSEGANALLAKFPPENVACLNESIVINYDDQTFPPAYMAEELRGLMLSNEKQIMTTEISTKVALMDIPEVEKMIAEAKQKLEDISTTVVKGTGKAAHDAARDRKEKIAAYQAEVDAYENRKRQIEQTIAGFKNSIKNFKNKNIVLLEQLALIGHDRNGPLSGIK